MKFKDIFRAKGAAGLLMDATMETFISIYQI